MSKLKRLNNWRRAILLSITQPVGRTNSGKQLPAIDPQAVTKVLICRPNHRLGNQLLTTPLVQEVLDTFPNATVDFFVKGGVVPVLYTNYDRIGRFISLPKKHFKQLLKYLGAWVSLRKKRYDLVINVIETSSSGRLSTKFTRSKYKLFGGNDEQQAELNPDFKHNAKRPVYRLRHALSQWGIPERQEPVPYMNIRLSEKEIETGKQNMEGLVNDPSLKTICLYTFATGAKCYDQTWWLPFLEALRTNFPTYNFLEILPVENVSSIDFKEPALYSKNIREMAAVMANTSVLITADCGVMHLASAAQVPIVALFSVTQPEIYGPYNPPSVSLKTEGLQVDEIITTVKNILNR